MKSFIRKPLFMFLGILFFLCTIFSARAEVIQQTFDHSLGIGTSAQSWEHRIDVPENFLAKGKVFTNRRLELTDKLVIEREELTGSYYYIKVRLPKAWLFTAKGSVKVSLEIGTPQLPAPGPVSALKVSGKALAPTFAWAGTAGYYAISLLNKGTGATVWERVLIGKTTQAMDENELKAGNHYAWAVKQANESAKYSSEANAAFRVDTKYTTCTYCMGKGSVICTYCNGSGVIMGSGPHGEPIPHTCTECNGSGRQICTFCNGTGQVATPIIVPE
ncbi:MAG: hypothetical protein HQM08_20830 [Candidatus Riflebacteria bacterium]|nr:hypothetical protein [Candidatus Riflebacteria bacterium]